MRSFVLLTLLCLCLARIAWAEGTLTHLSGPVSVKKLDGRTLPGASGDKVQPGETVITGEKGYVRVEMTDGGEMVLRPESELKISAYRFNKEKPAEDNSVFSLFKGGLRKVTGLIGKRGNQDAYKLETPTATIGIRGTQFDIRICQGNCGALADGVYLAVRFGAVQTTNNQGSMTVPAGKVVYVPPLKAPVILPRDPGIGFTPPAVIPKLDEKKKLQESSTTGSGQSGSAPGQAPANQSGTPAQGSSGQGSGQTEGQSNTQSNSQTNTQSENTSQSQSGQSSPQTNTNSQIQSTSQQSSTTTTLQCSVE